MALKKDPFKKFVPKPDPGPQSKLPPVKSEPVKAKRDPSFDTRTLPKFSSAPPPGGQFGKDISNAGKVDRGEITSSPGQQFSNQSVLPPQDISSKVPPPDKPSQDQSFLPEDPIKQFPSEEQQRKDINKGLSNVIDVRNAILDPNAGVYLNLDNSVFTTAAEYVANNPLFSASILTGIYGLYSWGVKALTSSAAIKLAAGEGIPYLTLPKVGQTAFQVSQNTKTAQQTAVILSEVAAKNKMPAYAIGAIGAMIGTYPWSEWSLTEALEGMIFNVKSAISTGDDQLIQDYLATSDQIFNFTTWEQIARLIPFVNIYESFKKKVESLKAQKVVNDKLIENYLTQPEGGEESEEYWKRVGEQQVEQEKQIIDYYNSERKKAVLFETTLNKLVRQSKTEEEKKQRQEEADFWAAERKKQREEEAKDRIAVAEFWTAYRKTQNEIRKDNTPSQLKFGLLG